MRIGIIAPRPVPDAWGGAERAVQGVAEALTDLGGHDVEVVKLPVDEQDAAGGEGHERGVDGGDEVVEVQPVGGPE